MEPGRAGTPGGRTSRSPRAARPPPRRWPRCWPGGDIVAAFTSPALRAAQTAGLAGLPDAKLDPDLWEWDYGGYEGLTTPQIQEQQPGWYLWRDGVIPGDAEHPGETVRTGRRASRPGARPGIAAAEPTVTSR